MTADEVFAVWAPTSSVWSQWVAPVLFAQVYWDTRIGSDLVKPQELELIKDQGQGTAVVLDLPGAESVEAGFALAGRGIRLVPLFNASPGPEEIIGLGIGTTSPGSAAIDVRPIVDAICRVTPSLQHMAFSPEAPPAFLLDSTRLSGTRPIHKGMFDNRWIVFPQDFPSANLLASHGIQQVLLVQRDRLDPQDDLAHVLLRWQEGGIVILSKKLEDNTPPCRISVKCPSKYRAAWYRALAILGLRRNSAGGFGSYIPETTAAG